MDPNGETDWEQLADQVYADLKLQMDRGFLVKYELNRIGLIQRIIEHRFPKPGSIRILDVGFLNGLVPYVLFKLDTQGRSHITSTERELSENFELGRKMSSQAVFPANRHAIEALDLDRLDVHGVLTAESPIKGQTFDVVVFGEVIEHIPNVFADRIMKFFHQILSKEGVLIVTTPNLHGWRNRLRHLLGVEFTHDPVAHDAMGFPHINLFSARLLCDLAKANGFSVQNVFYRDFATHARLSGQKGARRIFERLRIETLSRFFPSTRDDLILAFSKAAPEQPSAVFGRQDATLRAGLKAVPRSRED